MTIDWWTLGLQAANFLILAWLLKRFLFQPVKQVIERREALSVETARKLEQDRQAAQSAKAEFEAKSANIAMTRRQLKEEALGETARDRERIIEDARAEAAELVDDARSGIADERQHAVADLKLEIADLAADLAVKLLTKAAPDVADTHFLEQLEAKLGELGETELERLQKADGAASGNATIVTARPLARDAQDKWGKRIGKALGTEGTINFKTDPDLIAGAALHFRNMTVKSDWGTQLEQAKAAIFDEE